MVPLNTSTSLRIGSGAACLGLQKKQASAFDESRLSLLVSDGETG